MKYTVVVNQVGVADAGLWAETDLSDWALLDYVKDWIYSARAERTVVGGLPYVWLNFSTVLEEMPCLRMKTKGALARRLRRLQRLNLLHLSTVGQRVFVYPSARYSEVSAFRLKPLPTGNGPLPASNGTVADGQRSGEDHYRTSIQGKSNIPYAEIVAYMNTSCGTAYRSEVRKTQELIRSLWNQGFRVADFEKVIDNKSAEWLGDPDFEKYLRPQTLFGSKFESYLNQRRCAVRKERRFTREEAGEYAERNKLAPESFERRQDGNGEYYVLKG